MRKKSELILNLLLLPIDGLAVLSAFVLAYILRVKLDGRPVAYPIGAMLFLKIVLFAVPVWIIIFALAGLYNMTSINRRFAELGKIVVGVSGGAMTLILLDFFSRQPIFPSRAIPVYGYGLSLVLVVLGRTIWRAFVRSLNRYGIAVQNAVVVGSGPIARMIIADLTRSPKTGYQVVAVLETARHAGKQLRPIPVYRSIESLVKAHGLDIQVVIQADSALTPGEVQNLVNYASSHHWRYRFVPNQFGMFATNAEFATIAGLPVIEICRTPLDGWGRIVKRLFDVFGALAGMVVLSPLYLVIAIISKLTDPGPVFYSHKRVSRSGAPIQVYKFRTMTYKWSPRPGYKYTTAEEALIGMGRPDLVEEFKKSQKLEHDPRVNAFGRFLRRSSLDELPQLFNVLRGELSLVGPRPVVEAELERYGDQAAAFLSLKPGITGMWQVSGRSDIGYDERVKLDIYYVENWSLLLDIQILIKTFVIILRGRGAY